MTGLTFYNSLILTELRGNFWTTLNWGAFVWSQLRKEKPILKCKDWFLFGMGSKPDICSSLVLFLKVGHHRLWDKIGPGQNFPARAFWKTRPGDRSVKKTGLNPRHRFLVSQTSKRGILINVIILKWRLHSRDLNIVISSGKLISGLNIWCLTCVLVSFSNPTVREPN